MRALVAVTVLAIAVSQSLGQEGGKKAQAQVMSAAEKAQATPLLKNLSNDLLRIAVTRDPKVLERVMAPDVMIVDPHGKIFNLKQEMDLLKSGQFKAKIAEMKADDLQVKYYGRTAVVTGRSTVKGTFQGKSISGTYRFTQIFMDRGQGFQMVTCLSTLDQSAKEKPAP
jgi:hypothetical protein